MIARVGDFVEWRQAHWQVIALDGSGVRLRSDDDGHVAEVLADELLRDDSFRPRAAEGASDELSAFQAMSGEQAAEVRFWVAQLRTIQAEFALPGTNRGAVIESAARRLQAAGRTVHARTLWRKLQRFEKLGPAGLVDRRAQRTASGSRADARVIAALAEVMEREKDQSTGTRSRLIVRTRMLLDERFGPAEVPLPSEATMRRLISRLEAGRFTTGSARTRASLANQPDRVFEPMSVARPGEQVQVDSTKLDVMVELADGVRGRAELTILLDVVTRTILAAVVRPIATKTIDLVVLLARALVPYSRRPDAVTRQLAAGSLGAGALSAEELDEYRRQRLYIFPETITTDRGSVFVSDAFQAACARLGISLNTSAPYTPTDKPWVERMFGTINHQFTQFLDGYLGRSPEYWGKDAASWPTLAVTQLQALVDEWVLVVWQNRPHSGLRDPLFPSRKLAPNEMTRAWRRVAPELPVPFDAQTYISLMPTKWCAIGAGGIQIGNRTYDSAELRPLRRMDSPHTARRGKWPVHCDPHNIQTVWLELDGRLLPLAWKSGQFLGPLSDDVWAATREPGFLNRSADAEARRIKHAARIIQKGADPGRQAKKDLARQAGVREDPAQLQLEASVHPVAAVDPPASPVEPEPDLAIESAAVPAITSGFGLLEDTDWERA